jgi:hypothetical protein
MKDSGSRAESPADSGFAIRSSKFADSPGRRPTAGGRRRQPAVPRPGAGRARWRGSDSDGPRARRDPGTRPGASPCPPACPSSYARNTQAVMQLSANPALATSQLQVGRESGPATAAPGLPGPPGIRLRVSRPYGQPGTGPAGWARRVLGASWAEFRRQASGRQPSSPPRARPGRGPHCWAQRPAKMA